MDKVVDEAGGDAATVVDLGAGARPPARRGDGPEASRYDPHWWHDPRNVEAAVARDPRRARAAPTRRDARRFARNAAAYLRRLRALDARHRALHRRRCRRRSASWSPTTTRSATSPRRYGIAGRRRGHPLADDAGPAVGGRPRGAERADPARARQGGLPRELAQPEARRGDRAPDRRHRATTRSTATRSGRRAPPGATYLGDGARQRRRDGARLHRRRARVHDRGPVSRASALVAERGPRRRLRRAARPARRHASRLGPASASAVLGPNGGGKTTLFRALLGELAPLAGHRLRRRRAAASCRRPSARAWTSRSARSTWRSMGALSRLPWWRRPGRARARAGACEALDARRPRRRGADRPSATSPAASASACWSRARSCRTRGVLLLDEPFTGLDAQRRAPRAAARAARRRGPRAADRHPRRRPGAPLGPRALPQRPPGRLRRARRGAHAGRARGDLRRRDRRAADGVHRGILPRPPRPRAECSHCPRRPLERADHAPRVRRGRAARHRRRRARLLGGLLRPLLQRRVARPRAVPRPRRWRRCSGCRCCWAGRSGSSSPRSPSRSPAARRRSAATPRWRSWSPALFGLGVLLALSPDTPAGLRSLLFGDVLGVTDGDLAARGAARGRRRRRARAAARAAARRRLRPHERPRRSACAPRAGRRRAARAARRWRSLVAVQGLGNLLVVAVLVAPAATARLLTRRMGR